MSNEYRLKETGEVLTYDELRNKFPNVSPGPNWLKQKADLVLSKAKPTCKLTERVVRADPPAVKRDDGKWEQAWEVVSRSEDEFSKIKDEMLDYIRKLRKTKEESGTTFTLDGENYSIKTDAWTQVKLDQTKTALEVDDSLTEVDWEREPYEWSTVDLDQVKIMITAVSRHVEACFSNVKRLQEDIETAESFQDLQNIDTHSGWPGEE